MAGPGTMNSIVGGVVIVIEQLRGRLGGYFSCALSHSGDKIRSDKILQVCFYSTHLNLT